MGTIYIYSLYAISLKGKDFRRFILFNEGSQIEFCGELSELGRMRRLYYLA
jgi:hypothetical protein